MDKPVEDIKVSEASRIEWEERQIRRNQEAGLAFDDMWMFGESHAVKRLKRLFK